MGLERFTGFIIAKGTATEKGIRLQPWLIGKTNNVTRRQATAPAYIYMDRKRNDFIRLLSGSELNLSKLDQNAIPAERPTTQKICNV